MSKNEILENSIKLKYLMESGWSLSYSLNILKIKKSIKNDSFFKSEEYKEVLNAYKNKLKNNQKLKDKFYNLERVGINESR